MPHSLGQVYVHLVLPTKGEEPYLADRSLRGDLWGYMTGIFRNLDCPSLRIGGGDNHVHVLFRLSRVSSIAHVVRELQQGSIAWLRSKGLRDFEWHADYSAFSVSPRNVDRVIRYVRNQEEYHRQHTFQKEYRDLLHKCDGLLQKVDVHP